MARMALFSFSALALAALGAASATPSLGPDSGKPVPRFESLKYGEVNGRRGPSPEQQVLWTYHRRGLPVEVVAESGDWRQIKDSHGDMSWISAAMLEPRRTALVVGAEPIVLRRAPRAGARANAFLAPGVVAQLTACYLGWRELKVGGRKGWAEVAALWGAERCEGL